MLLHWESSRSSNSSMACSSRSFISRGNFESCFSASRETSTRKRMFHVAPRFGLPALELRFAPADNFRFRGSQGVVGNNSSAFRLYEHAAFFLCERHKIPCLELEGFENFPRDHHLPALSYAADPLLGWGCLHGTYYIWISGLISV